MTTQINEPRNYVIKDVELNYAKVAKPVSPFGVEQYEVQIATTDRQLAETLKANFFNVKEKDGKFIVSLKRKAQRADGSDNGAPKVFDKNLQPIEGEALTKIGNGSRGNVKVFQYPYSAGGRSGIAGSLTAIQITDLVEYSGMGSITDGFDLPSAPGDSTVEDAGAAF